MALRQRFNSWFDNVPKFKLLLIVASLLAIQAFTAATLVKGKLHTQQQQQQQQTQSLTLANSSDLFSYYFYIDDQTAIEQQAKSLLQQPQIQSVSLYKHTGEKIFRSSTESQHESQHTQPQTRVIPIRYLEQDYGYLLIGFQKNSSNTSYFQSHYWIYLSAIATWLLLVTYLFARTLIRKNSSTNKKVTKAPAPFDNKQQLQLLLKRNQPQRDSQNFQKLLLIHTDWDTLNARALNRLIKLLDRWLAHTGACLLGFKSNLLELGFGQSIDKNSLQQIQILDNCLRELGLMSKMLLHEKTFTDEEFINSIDEIAQAIWLDSQQLDSNQERYDKQPEVEPSDKKALEKQSLADTFIYKLANVSVQQQNNIERQTRFFLN